MQKKRSRISNEEMNILFNQGRVHATGLPGQLGQFISALTGEDIHIKDFIFYSSDNKDFIIEIQNSNSKIIVENCGFESGFILRGQLRNQLIFHDVIFHETADFNLQCKGLTIVYCTTEFPLKVSGDFRKLSLMDIKLKSLHIKLANDCSVLLQGTVVRENCSFEGSTNDKVQIHNCRLSALTLEAPQIQTLEIKDRSEVDRINFAVNKISDLRFEDSKVCIITWGLADIKFLRANNTDFEGLLDFRFDENKEEFHLFNCKAYEASFEGTLQGVLEITGCTFRKITFRKFQNAGELRIFNLRLLRNGILSIIRSNLGKAQIHESDLSKVKFEFDKSQISEIFISETDFPTKIYLDGKVNYNQGKLAYGQLQTVFQKQGDTIRSYEYLSREIDSHYRDISYFSSLFATKLNLRLNHLSNDFGRSWSRGILFTFVVGLFFFWGLILSTDQYTFGLALDWDWDLLGPYLKFMNPLRSSDVEALFVLDKTPAIKLTNISFAWDFIGRIFIAYGYYQTIQAFRKFGRK